MTDSTNKDLSSYLSQFDEQQWLEALDSLLPCIHEVDRNALQIWFRFYPLDLVNYLESLNVGVDAPRLCMRRTPPAEVNCP